MKSILQALQRSATHPLSGRHVCQNGFRCLGLLTVVLVCLNPGPHRFLPGSLPPTVLEAVPADNSALVTSPTTAATQPAPNDNFERWEDQEPTCQPFENQLTNIGDLFGNGLLKNIIANRSLSLAELQHAREDVEADAELQDRAAAVQRATSCSAAPEPAWEVVLNETLPEDVRYRDNSSWRKVAVDVDLRPQPNFTGVYPTMQLTAFPKREDIMESLRNKWVYMHGDSTLRQACCELVKFLSEIVYSFKEFKNLVRHKIDQFGLPFQSNSAVSVCVVGQPEWEFWPGPCENITGCECDRNSTCVNGPCPEIACNPAKAGNEVTFTWYFGKLNMTLTFDWKAQILQRYDLWLLQRKFARRAPDLYITTAGMHDCFWPASRRLGAEYHATQVRLLIDYVATYLPVTTPVIILPAQLTRAKLGTSSYDLCLEAVNAAARDEAARWGFAYLDRDRVLRSLLSVAEENTMLGWFLDLDAVHFMDWVQFIVRQYLLNAISCVLQP